MVSRLPAKRLESRGERGSALIEFLLSSLVWLPLLIGVTYYGINLIRSLQVSQLSRNAGHMYAYGIDFTQPQNQTLLTPMAAPLNIQPASGSGALLLSRITLVTDADCAAANMTVCPNDGKYVFTSFFVFGNRAYAKTQLGNPNTGYFSSGSTIQAAQYLSDPSLVATNFSSLLTFPPGYSGQYAFVSEVNWTSFDNTGSYARSIF